MGFKEHQLCRQCHAPLVWDHLTNGVHDRDLCIKRQLDAAKAEIKTLKAAVAFWKDAWYEVREIIGKLWWHHPAFEDEKIYQYHKYYHQQYVEKENGDNPTG